METLSILDGFISKHGLGEDNLSLNIKPSFGKDHIIEKAISEFANARPIDNYSYLESRGITSDMANHTLFQNQIYNAKYTAIDGMTYDNTIFPIRGNTGLIDHHNPTAQGFDIKNTTYKGKSEGSYTGFWRSNYDSTKKIDTIFISESPLDCISHYFLNETKLKNKNVLYLATCGTLQDSQIEIIQNAFHKGIPILDNNKVTAIGSTHPDNLTLLFDRDLKGGYYSAKILNAINFSDVQRPEMPDKVDLLMMNEESKIKHIGRAAFANADAICSVNDKNNSVTIHFTMPNNNDKMYSEYTQKYAQQQFQKLNRENAYKTTATEPFSLKIRQNDNTKFSFTVNFRNIQDHWKIINNFIIDNKFNKSEKIKIENAILKDFNDDLKAIKGIDKELQNSFNKRLEKMENPYKNLLNEKIKKIKI